MQRVSLLSGNALPVDPEGQKVLFLQRSIFEFLQRLLGPLLKPAAHRRLAEAKPVDKLAHDLSVVPLREPHQNGLYHLRAHLRAFHRLIALQRAFLLRVGVSNARHVDRDLLSVDPDRAGIRPPSAKGVLLLSAVALSSKILDFFLKQFLSQEASHLCVVLNQAEFRVDRAVENVSKGSTGWRLFGVSAMLRGHRQGFFVGERLLLMCTGEEPLLRIEFQLDLNIHPRKGEKQLYSLSDSNI